MNRQTRTWPSTASQAASIANPPLLILGKQILPGVHSFDVQNVSCFRPNDIIPPSGSALVAGVMVTGLLSTNAGDCLTFRPVYKSIPPDLIGTLAPYSSSTQYNTSFNNVPNPSPHFRRSSTSLCPDRCQGTLICWRPPVSLFTDRIPARSDRTLLQEHPSLLILSVSPLLLRAPALLSTPREVFLDTPPLSLCQHLPVTAAAVSSFLLYGRSLSLTFGPADTGLLAGIAIAGAGAAYYFLSQDPEARAKADELKEKAKAEASDLSSKARSEARQISSDVKSEAHKLGGDLKNLGNSAVGQTKGAYYDSKAEAQDTAYKAANAAGASYLDQAELKGKSLLSSARAEGEKLKGEATGEFKELKEVSPIARTSRRAPC